jgi:hypothetical protein
MRKYIIKILALIMVFLGYLCVDYYVERELGVYPFIIGFLGFVLLGPAMTAWENVFKNFIDKD